MNILKLLLIWINKIDVDSLLNEKKRLSEENGRYQFRCNTLAEDNTFLEGQVEQVTSELVGAKEKLDHEIMESKKLRKRLDELSKDLHDTKELITTNEKEIKNLKCQIKERDEEISLLNKNAETSPTADNEIDNEVQDQIDNLKRENARLQEDNKKKDADVKQLRGEKQ